MRSWHSQDRLVIFTAPLFHSRSLANPPYQLTLPETLFIY